MAQQPSLQQRESLEIIPFRNFGNSDRELPFRSPLAQAPFQEGSGSRNFDPRSEAFGPRDAFELRRPYSAAYQGESGGPDALRAYEGPGRQYSDGPQGGPYRGHGGRRKCRGHHAHRPNESLDQRTRDLRPREERQFDRRPYDVRQYNYEGGVAPSLSAFSLEDVRRQWRNDPFAYGR